MGFLIIFMGVMIYLGVGIFLSWAAPRTDGDEEAYGIFCVIVILFWPAVFIASMLINTFKRR